MRTNDLNQFNYTVNRNYEKKKCSAITSLGVFWLGSTVNSISFQQPRTDGAAMLKTEAQRTHIEQHNELGQFLAITNRWRGIAVLYPIFYCSHKKCNIISNYIF